MKNVQDFYNQTPFPDYDLENFNSKEELKAHAYPFAKLLDRSIPQNASIIDVGTGTGQLSAYLSLKRKCVYGIDFSDSSLDKAHALKKKLKLDSLTLFKADITSEKQIEAIGRQFDYVLCMGVLHHTGDAHNSFNNIAQLLNPKGRIAVGLYNTIGRIPLQVRVALSKNIFKNNQTVKDYFIKMQIGDVSDKERSRGWWNDQYEHPHETTHTVGEVLKWFKENNIAYIESVPSLKPLNTANLTIAGVWNGTDEPYPYAPIRYYKQLLWLWRTHKEGGYWLMFGQSK